MCQETSVWPSETCITVIIFNLQMVIRLGEVFYDYRQDFAANSSFHVFHSLEL